VDGRDEPGHDDGETEFGISFSSSPDLIRRSIHFAKKMDARVKPAHDDRERQRMREERLSRPTRTARYMARVEAHLPALCDDYARRDFISREMDKWEERYARFIATEGESHRHRDDADQPSAFDFTETIAALGAAQARFSGATS
jgi:hypothetical protein